MTAVDILFDPIPNIITPAPQGPAVHRYRGALSVNILTNDTKQTYTDIATEIMDHAVTESPSLTDVRIQSTYRPAGALDLVGVVSRFYDGNSDLWISRPKHMVATMHKFTGRFGRVKACRMPKDNKPLGTMTWYWIDTDDGQLPAIDLGLLVVHPLHQWYHVFTNQNDAAGYYKP